MEDRLKKYLIRGSSIGIISGAIIFFLFAYVIATMPVFGPGFGDGWVAAMRIFGVLVYGAVFGLIVSLAITFVIYSFKRK